MSKGCRKKRRSEDIMIGKFKSSHIRRKPNARKGISLETINKADDKYKLLPAFNLEKREFFGNSQINHSADIM
jgi:hypothetical protein